MPICDLCVSVFQSFFVSKSPYFKKRHQSPENHLVTPSFCVALGVSPPNRVIVRVEWDLVAIEFHHSPFPVVPPFASEPLGFPV